MMSLVPNRFAVLLGILQVIFLAIFLAGTPALAWAQPTVSLTLDDDDAAEAGADTGSFTVSRTI